MKTKLSILSLCVFILSSCMQVSIAQDAETYFNRGLAYFKQGKYELAIADFTSTIKINPQFAEAYYIRGLAYCKQGKYELCISDLKKAADLGDNKARKNLKEIFNIDY